MSGPMFPRAAGAVLLLCLLSACERSAPLAPAERAPLGAAEAPAPAAEVPAAAEVEDVVETTSDYVVGISYPDGVARYPGLVAELRRYADAARADLLKAAATRKGGPGAPIYDLALSFTELAETPTMVVIAADGSTYTGGDHSRPLLARFVWLVQEKRLLTAERLVPQSQSWDAIATDVRRQLHAALAQRVDADGLVGAERASLMKSAGAHIDSGAAADSANFSVFEPVLDRQGRIRALRFVFPPLQVGEYADGLQTVEVPAHVLAPHVAAEYRGLLAVTIG